MRADHEMPHPASYGGSAIGAENAATFARLSASLATLVAEAEQVGLLAVSGLAEASGETPSCAALRRILSGQGSDPDFAVLGMPLAGTRVLHIVASSAQRADLVSHALVQESGCVALRSAALRITALVRDVPRRAGEDRAWRMAHRLAAAAVRIDPQARAGVSGRIDDPAQAPGAAQDAADAAIMAAAGVINDAATVWAQLTLRRLQDHATKSLGVAEPVRRLLAYDREHGTDFASTLSTWLRSNQDTRRAASEMMIHANTLRYRIKRACALSGLDLEDPDQRLAVQILLLGL